ncbi:MAG: aldehyde dehydrogenase family protein [Bacteroidota bacterium]
MSAQRFLAGGRWLESDRRVTVRNPWNGRTASEVFLASGEDIRDAVCGAAEAFGKTRFLQAYERAGILNRIAAEVEASAECFARTITDETGKPISYSRTEVDRSVFTFRTAAQEATRMEGSVLPLDLAPHSRSRTGILRRFPLGPVAAITPFNFPLNLVAHKVAPAIAVGNTVLLKPSSSAPLTALLLGAIIHESGLPPGALSVLPGPGAEMGQLIESPEVKLISFTGSPGVGWDLKARAGKKKIVLELGGNAAVVVDESADLDFAIGRILPGAFGNAGQSCIAVQRIYVHRALYAEFERRLLDSVACLAVGDPGDEKTVVGPMIDEKAARQAEEWVREALGGGARLLAGGTREGALLHPTVLSHVSREMKVHSAEVFAPVVTIAPFDTMEEAIALVNDSCYGLQAGIFTADIRRAFQAYGEMEVGGVVVNDVPTYRIDHMPYGGIKDSGFGREGIRYAMEGMTELKLLVLNLA